MKAPCTYLSPATAILIAALTLFAPAAQAAVIVGNDPIDRSVSDGWSNFVLKLDTEIIRVWLFSDDPLLLF